jgi:glycosyltransferase involved in cell wall biosynthesis
VYHVLWPEVRWINIPISLPAALLATRLDLFHATYVPPPWSPVRYVLTLHDISMFTHPELYPPAIRWRLQRLVLRGVKQARVILCGSRHSRDRIAYTFRVPAERLSVTPYGVHARFGPLPPEQARSTVATSYGLQDPYLLFVGSLVQRKNVRRLLEAFDRVRHALRPGVTLVLAGRRGWGAEEVDAVIADRGLGAHVRRLSYVDDQHLPALYGAAEMLVFPSLDEGFGFPVVEAMACGTPVLTSNVSSLPEVAGDAAVLVDPQSVEAIASGIQRLASDSELRTTLRAKGLARAEGYRWERTARETLEIYKAALR